MHLSQLASTGSAQNVPLILRCSLAMATLSDLFVFFNLLVMHLRHER